MRLQVHRGQALLILVVGVLAGIAVAGATLELYGVPPPVAARASSLLAQPRTSMPVRIAISAPGRVTSPSPTVIPSPTASPAAVSVEPAPTTTVIPAAVYTYPPETRGGGGGGGGSGGGHDGTGGSGRG